MYYYIIDPQKIEQKIFERVQNQLYSCVSQLRISGEMTRVTPLRTIPQLVETAVLREASTIVAVGYDSTIQEIINCLGDKEMTIGYVPLVDSELSKILGIAGVENACQTLAHRRVELLDLGQAQSGLFMTKIGLGVKLDDLHPKSMFDFSKFSLAANLKPVQMRMEIDDQFSAEFEVALGAIFNSRAAKSNSKLANPTDGLLDILLLPGITPFDAWKYRSDLATACFENIPGCAVMRGRRITISSPDGLPFYEGDRTLAKAPTTIQALPNKIRVIVGKDRTF